MFCCRNRDRDRSPRKERDRDRDRERRDRERRHRDRDKGGDRERREVTLDVFPHLPLAFLTCFPGPGKNIYMWPNERATLFCQGLCAPANASHRMSESTADYFDKTAKNA